MPKGDGMNCVVISLNRCPHGGEMLSLDYNGTGTNLTGQKCCGRWDVVKEWPMDARNLRSAISEMTDALEILDAQG